MAVVFNGSTPRRPGAARVHALKCGSSFVVAVALFANTVAFADETRSAREILEALTGKKSAASQTSGAEAAFTTRGIRPMARVSPAPAPPSVNLAIHFASICMPAPNLRKDGQPPP